MKSKLESILYTLYPFALVFFAFSIPISYRISIYALGFLALIGILLIIYTHNFYHISGNKISIGLIVFWFIHLLSLFYTDNIKYGLSDISQKISMLVIPLTLFSNLVDDKLIIKIKKAFVLSLFFSSIYFIIRALSLSLVITPVGLFFRPNPVGLPWENYFFYDLFVRPHHPTYYSMYLVLGITFLLGDIRKKTVFKSRWQIYLITLYFIGIIFLTSSKAGILTVFTVLLVILFWHLKSKGKLILSSALVVLIISGVFVATRNNRFSATITYLKDYTSQTEANDNDLAKKDLTRLEIWKSVPKVFSGVDLISGVGTGDVKARLKEAYLANNAVYAFNEELNTHNQFLQTLVGIGLIGFIVLISILLFSFYLAIRDKDMVLTSFIILIFINFMFEAVLERVFGVLFFSFFLIFLVNKFRSKV